MLAETPELIRKSAALPSYNDLDHQGTISSYPSGQSPTYDWDGPTYLYSDANSEDVELYVVDSEVSQQELEDLQDEAKCDRPVSYVVQNDGTTVISCPNEDGEACGVTITDEGITIVICEQ